MAKGLIDLQTDLTSLRYSTMPLGSKSPYIVKDIDNPPSSNQVAMEITKRIDDTSRIAQMLVDKPGIKYLLHEAELQQINAGQKIKKAQQGGKTLVGAVLQQIGKTVVSTLKIAGSTLAQIPVNGTGTHFIKGFRTDTYLQPSNGNNFSAFASFFGAGGVEGAQYALRGETVPGEHPTELTTDTRSSNFDYVGGDVFVDRNEKLNIEIPKDSDKHKALAESGKPITIPGPQYETTAQPYELGRSNQLKEADQGELLPNNGNDGKQVYTTQDTYTGKEAKDVIASALEGAPIPVIPTTPGSIYPKETTPIKGTLGITSEVTGDTPQYQNPSIHKHKAPGLFAEVTDEQKYYATQSANVQKVYGQPLNNTTAPEGTIGITSELKDDTAKYQNPFVLNYETPGLPTTVADSQTYYATQSANHLEVWGMPMKDTTVPLGTLGEPQKVKKDDPAYLHPSILTNKYLDNSEKGRVPDPALFADGILEPYIVDASRKNQDTWGEVLQNTTVPEGTIGRVRDRDPEVDSVPRFLPHIVDEKFDTIGPPPNYNPADTYLAYKRNIPTFNKNVLKESRVGLGEQGGRNDENKLINHYWTTSPDKSEIDSINALDISALNTRQDATKEARDLAKLYFEIITPDGSKFMHFRAFIDSIDDSYNANWEGHKYVGRAEDFYTYGGFSRDINISFKIVAATRSELKPLYRKMVYLASSTAPTYGSVGGFMRGTLARLTVGSYFDQIPGVITSVKYSLIDELPWEIAMLQPEGLEDGVQEVPTGLQCSVSFKPIHDFAPQTGLHHYFTSTEKSKTFFDEEVYTAVSPPVKKVPTVVKNVPPPPKPPVPVTPKAKIAAESVKINKNLRKVGITDEHHQSDGTVTFSGPKY